MSPLPSPRDLLSQAVAAAHAAGTHALKNTHRRHERLQSYAHDVKLQLDLECQRMAEETIHAAFPDHAILGEESPHSASPAHAASGFEWIIDPIDGTVNYSHGLPYWAASVAVRRREEVVAGAVYAPALNELYEASLDSPALCNGAPIRVSSIDSLAGAIVLTGMDKNLTPNSPPLTLFSRIALNSQKARILGSASLDMCQVARGYADGYLETGIYIWDVAAAGLIVRQAGGISEILQHDPATHRVICAATNGLIHIQLKELIAVAQSY